MPEAIAAPPAVSTSSSLPAASSSPAAPAPVTRQPVSGTPAPTRDRRPAPGEPNKGRAQSKQADNLNDAFAQLDKLGEESNEEPLPERQRPNDAQQREVDNSEESEEQVQPEAKPKLDSDLDPDGFPTEEGARKMRAGMLSKHYKALRAEYKKLQAKMTEAATRPVDQEKLTKLETEAKENYAKWEKAQAELRYTKYERSQEYQEKFYKPYEDAFTQGQARVSKLMTVERKDADTGEVVQPSRQGTTEDFNNLMQIISDDKAAEVAEQLFGVKAPMVLMAREKALEANQTRLAALEKYKTEGAAWEKAREENSTKLRHEETSIFDQEQKQAMEKYPVFFKPDDDAKGNELLEKAVKFVGESYLGVTTDENGQKRPLTPQEKARRHAVIANKAKAFDRLVYRNRNLLKEVSALKKKLEGYSESEPGVTTTRRTARAASGSTMDSVLAGLG